jgi:hypothetical protein
MSDLPGFADTPGPDATPEQDADVRALLAFLRDEPLELPPDVAARLDAVIAEERRTSTAAAGAASALADPAESSATPLAPVTVLPVATRRRGASLTAFTVVGAIAAAIVVVVGGITVVRGLGSGSGADSAGTVTAASAVPSTAASETLAPEAATSTRLTASGASYAPSSLAAQASTLAGLSLGTVKTADRTATDAGQGTAPGYASTPVPTPSATDGNLTGAATGSGGGATTGGSWATAMVAAPTDARALEAATLTPDKVASCVRTLTDGDGTQALAVDAGTWQGKAALLVILPTQGDATSLDVIVVTRDCSPDFLTFQRIPRP